MYEIQQEDGSQEIISKIRLIRYIILQRRTQLRKQVSLFDLQGFSLRPLELLLVSDSI